MQASANQSLLKVTIPSLATWAIAAMVGWLSAFSFFAALVLVGAVVFLALLALGEHVIPTFLVSLGLLLTGYAFGGRGFAYIGLSPIFVGELVLSLAGLVILTNLSAVQLRPIHLLLIGFMLWGLLRTLPYLQRDGVDALRDAVIWGYAFFAIAISLAVKPHHFAVISKWYGKIGPFFVCWVPVFFVLHNNFQ